MKDSEARLYTQKNLNWTNDEITVLGIDVSYEQEVLRNNYKKLIPKTAAILQSWSQRNISLIGKVNVINTLVASMFIYRMAVLPNMTPDMINSLNKLFNTYLWNGRRPKISLDKLQMDKKHGSLRLTDINLRQKAIKTTWIQTLHKDSRLAMLVYALFKFSIAEDVWCCNLNTENIDMLLDKRNVFWRDVLLAWNEYRRKELTTGEESCLIWFNGKICVQGKSIFFENAYRRGLKYPSQICSEGTFITYQQAHNAFDLTVMQHNQLVSAIPKAYKENIEGNDISQFIQTCLGQKNLSRKVYNTLLEEMSCVEKVRKKWFEKDGLLFNTELIEQSFCDIMTNTNIIKLRSFQYRFLHRAIVLNSHLYHWKIRENSLCDFCEQIKDSVYHTFYM